MEFKTPTSMRQSNIVDDKIEFGLYGDIFAVYAKDSERSVGGDVYAVPVYNPMLIIDCQYV